MFSAEQIKAARSFLGWSAADLANKSGVGATTIRRYEMIGGMPRLFEDRGSPGEKPGARASGSVISQRV